MPTMADALPALPGGAAAAAVWMVGQVGSEVWPHFSASSFAQDGLPDPLDRWSKSIGNPLAEAEGGSAVYPSDGPPWFPFQQWATRAEPVATSPPLLLVHPEYGLWHAYRFALMLPLLHPEDAAGLAEAGRLLATDVCARCDGQPCLHSCPVQAFTGTSYRVDDCASHLHSAAGADCMQGGCLARRACPVGAQLRYVPEQAAFHMQAFAEKH
ncbi:MAG: hypothetical protein ABIN37_07100 [Burkholderiaceae bacterium]